MQNLEGNKYVTIGVIIIIGFVIFGSLGFITYQLWTNNANLGADKVVEKEIIVKVYKVKGKVLSKVQYEAKKIERISDIKKMIAVEKQKKNPKLLGGSPVADFTDANEQLNALDEWIDISFKEGCWGGEELIDWEHIEIVNNKLENNKCI